MPDRIRRSLSWGALARAAAVTLAAGGLLVAGAAYAADEKAPADKPAKPVAKPADNKSAAEEKVTFAKVAPILKESCVNCHRNQPAGRAPGGPGGQGGPPGARRGPGGPGGPPGGTGRPGGGPRGPAGGLRLDDKAAILKGGKHGKAVIPGKGEESLLFKVLKEPVTVDGEEIHAMPKARPGQDFTPINDDEIELIKTWIDQGAK